MQFVARHIRHIEGSSAKTPFLVPVPPPFPTLTRVVNRQWCRQVAASPAENSGLAMFRSPTMPPVDEVGWRHRPIRRRCCPRRHAPPHPVKGCGCLGPGPPSKVLLLSGRGVAVEAERECCVLGFFHQVKKKIFKTLRPIEIGTNSTYLNAQMPKINSSPVKNCQSSQKVFAELPKLGLRIFLNC